MKDNSYWCLLSTRNRHDELRRTLNSLLGQSVLPSHTLVFDDGSNPPVSLPEWFGLSKVSFHLLRREDEGYNICRLPQNWNECLKYGEAHGIWATNKFIFITADDCIYPSNYCHDLLERMITDDVAVASGSRGIRKALDGSRFPEGSGRMIRSNFLSLLGGRFPEKAGNEPWVAYEAIRRGLKVACYDDLAYQHLGKFGAGHGFRTWGKMAYTMGYDPIFFTLRCMSNFVNGNVPKRAILKMFWDYLTWPIRKHEPYYEPFNDGFRSWLGKTQRKRLLKVLRLA